MWAHADSVSSPELVLQGLVFLLQYFDCIQGKLQLDTFVSMCPVLVCLDTVKVPKQKTT